MSFQTYNFIALKRIAKAAADKAPDAQLIDLGDIVNDAYMQVATCRKWQWRNGNAILDTVEDQAWVVLPTDLASLDVLHVQGTMTGLAIPVTLDKIILLRANSQMTTVIDSFTYHYAVAWTPQASATALPTPRLELFPTPSANATGVFLAAYTRIPAKLSADTDVLDMPPQFQQAVRQAVRASAMRETNQKGWDVAQAQLDAMLNKLATEDGLLQGNLGRMSGMDSPSTQTIVRVDPVVTWPNA